MKNDVAEAVDNCRICKLESPDMAKYVNLHLEISSALMQFLATDTIEVRKENHHTITHPH